MKIISSLAIGILFGIGIMISGMANPAKVLNFFDVFGNWDPSLIFVMGGALLTTVVGYRFVLARDAPLLEQKFNVPATRRIDGRLIAGAALFGVGWGIAGFCPGGAIPALGTGRLDVAIFMVSLAVGIVATRVVLGRRLRTSQTAASSRRPVR